MEYKEQRRMIEKQSLKEKRVEYRERKRKRKGMMMHRKGWGEKNRKKDKRNDRGEW